MLTYDWFWYQAKFEAEREGRAFSHWIVWLDSNNNRLPSALDVSHLPKYPTPKRETHYVRMATVH